MFHSTRDFCVIVGKIVSEPSDYNKTNRNGKHYGNVSCKVHTKFGDSKIVEARLYIATKKKYNLAVGKFVALHVITSGDCRGLAIVRPLTDRNYMEYIEHLKIVEYNNTPQKKLLTIAQECDISRLLK